MSHPTAQAVRRAISHADRILPGKPAPDGKRDPRWQAIIRVAQFIESEPEDVWAFTLRWAKHPQTDVRAAVATCLLEHLLDAHFDLIFPRVRAAAMQSKRFAETLGMIWFFGDAATPDQRKAIERLQQSTKPNRKKELPSKESIVGAAKPPPTPLF